MWWPTDDDLTLRQRWCLTILELIRQFPHASCLGWVSSAMLSLDKIREGGESFLYLSRGFHGAIDELRAMNDACMRALKVWIGKWRVPVISENSVAEKFWSRQVSLKLKEGKICSISWVEGLWVPGNSGQAAEINTFNEFTLTASFMYQYISSWIHELVPQYNSWIS